jgi:hypothetical protein
MQLDYLLVANHIIKDWRIESYAKKVGTGCQQPKPTHLNGNSPLESTPFGTIRESTEIQTGMFDKELQKIQPAID